MRRWLIIGDEMEYGGDVSANTVPVRNLAQKDSLISGQLGPPSNEEGDVAVLWSVGSLPPDVPGHSDRGAMPSKCTNQ